MNPLFKIIVKLAIVVSATFASWNANALCLSLLGCSCSMAVTGVSFPTYNPLSATTVTSAGNVKITCGGVAGLLVPFDIALSSGVSNSFTGRTMKSGANALSYNLYTDATYSTVWGDGTGSSSKLSSGILLDVLGLAPASNYPVYGQIPGNQNTVVPSPNYTDTISVTLTYY